MVGLKIAIGLGLIALLVLASVAFATHTEQHGGQPAPTTSSPPVVGEYFTTQGGRVWPTVNRTEYDWNYVEIRATTAGVHFNLNQPARVYDSSADDWSRVFTANAPFTTTDYVSFCAPQATITIQARDRTTSNGIGNGQLTEVPLCV